MNQTAGSVAQKEGEEEDEEVVRVPEGLEIPPPHALNGRRVHDEHANDKNVSRSSGDGTKGHTSSGERRETVVAEGVGIG